MMMMLSSTPTFEATSALLPLIPKFIQSNVVSHLLRPNSFSSSQHILSIFHHHLANYYHYSIPEDRRLFLNSIRQQCKLGFSDTDNAVSLFNEMKSLNPLPSILDFNKLFAAMCKIKPHPPYSTVVALSNELHSSLGRRPNDYSLNILVNCYCYMGRVDFGFSILGCFYKLGIPPDLVTFSTLVNGLIHCRKWDDAFRLSETIVELGFEFTSNVYGILIKGLCKKGDNVGAINLIRSMESSGRCTPDVVHYNTIIDSLLKHESMAEAFEIFAEMKSKGVRPDAVTYSTLVRAKCILGRWEEAWGLLNEMLGNNITIDVKTSNMLIDMYCKKGMVVEAHVVFDGMIKRGQVPNVITYNIMLNGYCIRGEMEKAEKFVNAMVEGGCKPDECTFGSLIKGYCMSNKFDRALNLLQEMPLKGLKPDIITYTTLIDAFCKDSRLASARELLKDMEAQGLRPNVVTWNSLLHGLSEDDQIDDAMELVKVMKNNGVVPNIITYNVLIGGLFKAGRLGEAMDTFLSLPQKGVQPTTATYNIVARGLCSVVYH